MTLTDFAQALNASIEKNAFSGVVYVRQNGQVMYERAAGYADRANRRENTLDTRFGIASGTKFFTALAIGKLIEVGKLDFATKVAECIPWNFPRYSKEITIQHLLTHKSGIPDYYDEAKIDDFNNFTVAIPWCELRGPKDYLPVFPDEEMKFAPGMGFSYSNGGYILLGVIIEEVSGIPYRDFVTQEIFSPAGMTRSGYFAMNKLPENTAFGYIEEVNREWRTNIYNLPIIGASDGGAFTTVNDLARLWDAFWGYEILSQEMVQLYVKVENTAPGECYGHGVWIRDSNDRGREIYITGCDAGVSMKSGIIHATDTLVTVLSNTTDGAWAVLGDVYEAVKICCS
jgi:CubicO group peptidase (beta-lactamase class C family)